MTKADKKCEHGTYKAMCCRCNYSERSYVEYHGERAYDVVEQMNRNHRRKHSGHTSTKDVQVRE